MRKCVLLIVAALLTTIQPVSGLTSIADPVGAPPSPPPNLRTGTVITSNQSWTTVSLDIAYNSMVVVASAHYPADASPAVIRMRNASGNSFDVMVQGPCSQTPLTGITVHYAVIEEGVYTEATDGVKAEAIKLSSSITDNVGSWLGSSVTFSNTYTAPVVLGQVMSDNDSDWSQYWCYDGSSLGSPPSSLGAAIGKHVGGDPSTVRADETIAYIAIESGSGTLGGMDYIAAVGPDTITGPDDGTPGQYTFSPGFHSLSSLIASQAGMDGTDGGWAVVTSKSTTGFSMVIEEDQCADLERFHTTEQVGYLAFGQFDPLVDPEPKLRTGTVTTSNQSWTTVSLDIEYNSMVVVASAHYPADASPAVVRVQNASGSSFDVMVQGPCSQTPLTGITVHYAVIEEGVYTEAINGVKAEAVKLSSPVTDHSGSWVGSPVSYSNTYTAPVVLGQVMSINDAAWSQFWSFDGALVTNPPSANGLAVGKHVGEDSRMEREGEILGFLILETGTGSISGLGFEAGVGPDIIRGSYDGPPASYHPLSDLQSVSSVIVSQAGMDGAEGGWAVVTSLDSYGFDMIIEEDQCLNLEHSHTTEQAGYLILGNPSAMFPIFKDGFETRHTPQ